MSAAIIHLPLIEGHSQAICPFCLTINRVALAREVAMYTANGQPMIEAVDAWREQARTLLQEIEP